MKTPPVTFLRVSAAGSKADDDKREGMDFLVQEGKEILRISEDFSRRSQVYFDPKKL